MHGVALGESIAADRLYWFEILRHLLELRRPADAITLTNLAVSGSTTTHALKGLPVLGMHRPDWVLCQFGGNDAQRLGIGGPRVVSAEETTRNFTLLRERAAALGPARWIWLAPPDMDENLIANYPFFRMSQTSWSAKDLAEMARELADRPEPVVDALSVTHPAPEIPLHLDDGGPPHGRRTEGHRPRAGHRPRRTRLMS
ncbi:SGNH/GDSL hydrolase family protein [Nocardia sp. NPDC050710]|uniref:SGNH/GDSL hydrolase family protein n=1 Tax=Nocardia sp. NPDC050710 TaxID=3157220 RepID=UPI00340D9B53